MADQIVLKLGDDRRVLSAAWYKVPPKGAVIVPRSALPSGGVSDYRYVDGAFVYDPLPEPEPEIPAPTAEERITELESDKKLMDAQIQALSDRNDFLEDCIAEMATIIYA